MGGGGGRSRSIGDINDLIARAQGALSGAQQPERRNVFISFAYEDVSVVNLLRGQAKNENVPLEFNDWSVSEPINSERAEYVKSKIRERLERSSVLVVYLSDNAVNSQWVNWEIEEARRLGKGIVGVYHEGSPPALHPSTFDGQGYPVVPWKHDQLMAAIDRVAR